MDNKLFETVMKLPKEHIVNLMWNALDEMQYYNGRTKTTCILLAMGAKEADSDGHKWRIPSLKELKENTETMIPFS